MISDLPENLFHYLQQIPFSSYSFLLLGIDLLLRVGFSVRVIRSRKPSAPTLSWLIVILGLPFVGVILYLMLGENRLGEKRINRANSILKLYQWWQAELRRFGEQDLSELPVALQGLSRQALATVGLPLLPGNELQLLRNYQSVFRALINDIDNAQQSCQMQFYIWHEGGLVDDVAEALIRARQRGVICRVLVDAVGSKEFLRGTTVKRMQAAGVFVVGALPVSLHRLLFRRGDLRNHRKIVVIDRKIAFSGSQNLVDPRFFKQNEGVGQWVDIMIRIRGPVVEELRGVFFEDWHIETGRDVAVLEEAGTVLLPDKQGDVRVQAVPSGPVFRAQAIHRLLLTMLFSARERLVVTTPYFAPDEAIKQALISAALRGVDVILILPEKVDSFLLRHASRSTFEELLGAGVRIHLYRGGLLHTKLIVVDDEACSVGSVNLDMRSIWLNFEISLFIYDRTFTGETMVLVADYLDLSTQLDLESWQQASHRHRFIEQVTRLLGPLL